MWYLELGSNQETRRWPATRDWFIRNIAEVTWREFPDHHGGALSKPLVMPETAGAQHIDYRISMYQPMARVKLHKHKVQEQVYHVIEGEGLMEIDGGEARRAQARFHLPAARRRSFDREHRACRPCVSRGDVAGHRRRGKCVRTQARARRPEKPRFRQGHSRASRGAFTIPTMSSTTPARRGSSRWPRLLRSSRRSRATAKASALPT